MLRDHLLYLLLYVLFGYHVALVVEGEHVLICDLTDLFLSEMKDHLVKDLVDIALSAGQCE